MKCAWRSCLSRNKKFLVLSVLVKFLLLTPSNAAGAEPKKNIYANTTAWTNEKGETVSLSDLKGKRALFALFYTGCKTICPMTTKSIQSIEKALGARAKNLQIVLVTIDPADKAPQLRKFIHANNLRGWRVLAGTSEAAKSLAIDLGLGFEEKRGNPELHQMHSRTLVVVNEKGEVSGSLPIFEFDLQQAVALIGP